MLQLLSSLLERRQGSSGAPGARRFGGKILAKGKHLRLSEQAVPGQ